MEHRRLEILKALKPTLVFFLVALGIMVFALLGYEASPGNVTRQELDEFRDLIDQLYTDNAVMNTYASTGSGQVHGVAYLNSCGRQYVVYDNSSIDLNNIQASIDMKPNIAYASIGPNENMGALRGDYSTNQTTHEPGWLNYLQMAKRAIRQAGTSVASSIDKAIFKEEANRVLVGDSGLEEVPADEKMLQLRMSYDTYIGMWEGLSNACKNNAEYQLVAIRDSIKEVCIQICTDMTTKRFYIQVFITREYKDGDGRVHETYNELYRAYTATLAEPWEMDGVLAGPDTTKTYEADSLYRIIVNDLQPVTGRINTTFREKKVDVQFNLLNARALEVLGNISKQKSN